MPVNESWTIKAFVKGAKMTLQKLPTRQPPQFWRSPRLNFSFPQRKLEILAPPSAPDTERNTILTVILTPLLMATVMLVVGLAMGVSRWLVFGLPMMLISGLSGFLAFQLRKRQNARMAERRETKYREYLEQVNESLNEDQNAQLGVWLHNYPDVHECLRRITDMRREMWARSADQDDFLAVRIGTGQQRSTTIIEAPEEKNVVDPDPLLAEVELLVRRYRYISGAPATLKLRRSGAIGIGGDRERMLAFVRALIMHVATHHSPDEVKLAIIFSQAETDLWEWARWLPHVWSNDFRQRFMASDFDAAQQLIAHLNDMANLRQAMGAQLSNTGAARPPDGPHVIVIVADSRLVAGNSGIERLDREGEQVGVTTMHLRAGIREMESGWTNLIRIKEGRQAALVKTVPTETRMDFRYDEASLDMIWDFALSMAPVQLRRSSPTDIPTLVSLFDMLNVTHVEELDVPSRWKESQQASQSLSTPLGIAAGGEVLSIDLHERHHGPNGLVAGMVGSGKSEMLQTLVASLAINYHPERLAFFLADYKGGGMARPFRTLPHTLGIIDDLQKGHIAERAIESLLIEQRRREQMFAEAEDTLGVTVNHIDAYQKYYYQGKLDTPMPYLVIIVDEFAELKTEHPETAKQFIRIARVGRALGFRMILAMQKPAGIVDGQIEANTRFRLCLRVAQREDSNAMLKRPEAAYLTEIGRAYFKVGADEEFGCFQVAWSGADYEPDVIEKENMAIRQVGLNGNRILLDTSRDEEPQAQNEYPNQLNTAIEHLQSLIVSGQVRMKPPQRLWMDELPTAETLDRVCAPEGWNGSVWEAAPHWLAPVIGRIDDPENKAQPPLRIRLGDKGHLLVYGSPGSGKTTLLQTILLSLVQTYSPADVNVYAIDFGSQLLETFEILPHVGGVVVPDEEEDFYRLFQMLQQELRERKSRFSEMGVTTLQAFREKSDQNMPAIVVAIDNWAAVTENHPTSTAFLTQLTSEGGNLGIHVILTASQLSDVRTRLGNNFSEVIALYLNDSSYRSVVGKDIRYALDEIAGRGFIRATPPQQIQIALPIVGDTEPDRARNLEDRLKQIAKSWTGAPARPIPRLPEMLPLDRLLSIQASTDGRRMTVSPGIRVDDLQPFDLTLDSQAIQLITGSDKEGKTSLLRTLITGMAAQNEPLQVKMYLFDSYRRGLHPLSTLPHVVRYAVVQEDAENVLRDLQQEVAARIADRKAHITAQTECSQIEEWKPSDRIVIAVDDLMDPDVGILSNDAQVDLAKIIQTGRQVGVTVLVAANIAHIWPHRNNNAIIKHLTASLSGFLLAGACSYNPFTSTTLPRAKRLRLGEAYWIRSGAAERVLLATTESDGVEANSLDIDSESTITQNENDAASNGPHTTADWVQVIQEAYSNDSGTLSTEQEEEA